ncbi:MAG: rhomboid family intramembrane serine protease, partial [Stenotrophomonas sp.]
MDTPTLPDSGDTPATTARNDRSRVLRAFNISLGFVLLLVALFALQSSGWDWRPWAVAPLEASGLAGLLGAPLLHGSIEHL